MANARRFKWWGASARLPNDSILGVQLNIPHDHTHQLWHGRPPVLCIGSHTRWCDTSRNCLPFQLTYTLWAPGLWSRKRDFNLILLQKKQMLKIFMQKVFWCWEWANSFRDDQSKPTAYRRNWPYLLMVSFLIKAFRSSSLYHTTSVVSQHRRVFLMTYVVRCPCSFTVFQSVNQKVAYVKSLLVACRNCEAKYLTR